MARKKVKRVAYSLLISVLVFVLALATIVLYPQPLFANKMTYRQFNVYSNEKIGVEIKPVLDNAVSLVKSSELYDSTYKVDVFLGYDSFFNKIDDKVFGYGPTARTIDNNLVFKVAVNASKNLVYPIFHKPCEQQFSYVVAHEMVHCFQAHKYGMLKFSPVKHPEMWKLEGYPEYVAREDMLASDDKLKKKIKRFLDLNRSQTRSWISSEEEGCEVPEVYCKGRLMTTYLINVKQLTYDQILEDKRSEEEIYAEMIEWATK